MKDVIYAIDIKNVATNSLIGIILGSILTFVPMSSLVSIIIVIIGLLLIASNGYRLYVNFSLKNESSNETLFDVLGILAGFILLCFSGFVINIIVAIFLIIEPIIELALAKWDRALITKQLPVIGLGVILLISGISTLDIIFKILGITVIVLSLVYLLVNFYLYKKSGVKIIK